MKDIVVGAFEVTYEWNAGRAASRFLEGLKQGRILGSRCLRCKRTLVPPSETCERCSGRTEEGIEAASIGTVVSFSIFPRDGGRQGIIMVRLDGADTDLLHLISPGAEDTIGIGARVCAVWRPPEERKGHILDIVGFEPC